MNIVTAWRLAVALANEGVTSEEVCTVLRRRGAVGCVAAMIRSIAATAQTPSDHPEAVRTLITEA